LKKCNMPLKISFILPCRNEKEALGKVIQEIKEECQKQNVIYEIIVSDSSIDGSDLIAKKEKVKLIKHDMPGYGFAIKKGIENASYDIIIYGDADYTYNFHEFPKLLKNFTGDNIVMGNRLKGKIKKEAMPFSHRFLGTPFLNFLIRLFFGVKIYDSQSGFRLLNKDVYRKLNLVTNNMEFTVEMIIKAKKQGIKIKEVPIEYRPRLGISKLKPYKDGLADIKYIILEVPVLFYIITGGIIGLVGLIGLIFNKKLGRFFDTATVKIFFPLLGFQIIYLALFSKTYLYVKFKQENKFLKKFYQIFKLKYALFLGVFLIIIPILFKLFGQADKFFDPLIVSALVGIQIIFNSLYLSELSVE